MNETPPPLPSTPRILVVHEAAPTLRLIRENLSHFTNAAVDTTPDAVSGYEQALQRRYQLFIFNLKQPVLTGPLLYDLICKAYPHCHAGSRIAPGVVYITDPEAGLNVNNLTIDVRVKAVLVKPLTIERLLQSVDSVVTRRDPLTPPLK